MEPLMKDLKVIVFILKLAHRISKTYIPVVIASSVVTACMPFLNLIMMKLVIDELTGLRRVDVFIMLVFIVASGNFILNILSRCLKSWVNVKNDELLNGFDAMVGEKIMSLDFQMIEDPELSGGQNQKLALARALYKNGDIVILDEPTSALDPLAEFEIYQNFDQLIGHKTAVYISHRLSSTRFCDAIAFFENGEILEYGTHDELLAKNGRYAEMFRIQSQYYQVETEAGVASCAN